MTDATRYGPGRPIVHTHRKRGPLTRPEPRLCPTCLNILRLVDGQWECPKGHPQPGQAA